MKCPKNQDFSLFFSLTCKRTITHITLRSHNWLNIVTSVGFLIRPFQRREIKLKSKDSSKANFWVARLQIFMEKALLKKPCWNGGRGLYMTPYLFGIPTPYLLGWGLRVLQVNRDRTRTKPASTTLFALYMAPCSREPNRWACGPSLGAPVRAR